MVEMNGAPTDPLATGLTAPIELSIENVVALVVVQVRVGAPPLTNVLGAATSVQVGAPGGGVGVTVTGAVQWTVPPAPVAVRV